LENYNDGHGDSWKSHRILFLNTSTNPVDYHETEEKANEYGQFYLLLLPLSNLFNEKNGKLASFTCHFRISLMKVEIINSTMNLRKLLPNI
jgi:hypothetical protein